MKMNSYSVQFQIPAGAHHMRADEIFFEARNRAIKEMYAAYPPGKLHIDYSISTSDGHNSDAEAVVAGAFASATGQDRGGVGTVTCHVHGAWLAVDGEWIEVGPTVPSTTA